MIAIACIDKQNGIGQNGQLLISIPEDMAFFRENTKDSVVIMGRKTLYSFKDKAPLKNRINIVFTKNLDIVSQYKNFDNIYFIDNKSKLFSLLENYKDKKVFVIGGASIYNSLIDDCDTALITKLDKSFPSDTFFPDLTKHNFKIVSESEIHTYNDINYKFITYKKI